MAETVNVSDRNYEVCLVSSTNIQKSKAVTEGRLKFLTV